MSKLSKQEKFQIYQLWHSYIVDVPELSQRYRVGKTNINYLLALIDCHGLAILDQPFTAYTSNFKEQAPRRIIVEHEPLYHLASKFRFKKSWDKHPALNGLTFHTDQGWQYQNYRFQAWLRNHGISQSMSRKGNSLDDGLMEGFFGILKRERFYGFEKHFKNLTELENAIRDYIEYYNQKRIKIKLKGLTPLEYWKLVLS